MLRNSVNCVPKFLAKRRLPPGLESEVDSLEGDQCSLESTELVKLVFPGMRFVLYAYDQASFQNA